MKHTIWSNAELTPSDFKEQILEVEEEIGHRLTDEQQYHLIMDILRDDLLEEQMNLKHLNSEIKETIIGFGSFSGWSDKNKGYRTFTKLTDIFYTECDFSAWYVDGNGVFFDGMHNDGMDFIEYRILRSDVDQRPFLERLASGHIVKNAMLFYYTKSLAPYIKAAYGWDKRA